MRTLYITGLALGLSGLAVPAMADAPAAAPLAVMGKSVGSGMHRPMTGGPMMGGPTMGRPMMNPPMMNRPMMNQGMTNQGMAAHRWGQRINGRWYAGSRAPGGWVAYRRPVYGWTLPQYWIQPSFYISNYGTYGLPAPRAGYGWSRYYDDAVMTDQYGRVYDSRSDIAWDRYEGGYAEDGGDYRDGPDSYAPPPPHRDNGVGGAVIGAVAGGVAGNLIAGKGNRTVGTIVGAGVGAIAGAAIDKAEDAPCRAPRGPMTPPPGRGRYAGGPGNDGMTYDGTWSGTWRGDDGRSYSGEYSGTYNGTATPPPYHGGRPGVGYDMPPMGPGPHWRGNGPHGGSAPVVTTYSQPGYYAGGYYYPGATTTTVVIQPAVTTTIEETTYVTRRVVSPRRKVVRRACSCK